MMSLFTQLQIANLRFKHGLFWEIPLEWPEFNRRASAYFRELCGERKG